MDDDERAQYEASLDNDIAAAQVHEEAAMGEQTADEAAMINDLEGALEEEGAERGDDGVHDMHASMDGEAALPDLESGLVVDDDARMADERELYQVCKYIYMLYGYHVYCIYIYIYIYIYYRMRK